MLASIFSRILFIGCLIAALTACAEQSAKDTSRSVDQQAAKEAEPTPSFTELVPTVTDTPIPTPAEPSPTEAPAAASPIDYAAVRPYEVGQIMIIMYHGLVETEAEEETYQRSAANFQNDLQTFYDRGFRLISMKDWIENNITTPAGYTPLILTFDDGKASSFSLENADGELRPVKDCVVDIMTQFSIEHPDFGNTAMFFINQNPFKGEGTLAERLNYLLDHGYELGNHTMSHKQMSKMNADEIQAEIGGIDRMIKEAVPEYEPYALSYPFGERPLKDLRGYVLNGVWEGNEYHYKIAVREGQSGPPSAVNREGFDPINVPRVRGSNNQETDMGWTLKQYETSPELRYVSDGNPDRIAVPAEYADNVDMESLNGKELFIYEAKGDQVIDAGQA
jgi:peptidoglycan/xylan/chitin deacetylase (PgdA/CDA1 family)